MKEKTEVQLTQKYFWGRHSGVGGGLNREMIYSAITFEFLVAEMKARGLRMQIAEAAFVVPRDFGDVLPPRHETLFNNIVKFFTGSADRSIESVDMLDGTVIKRYEGLETYRPAPLKHLHDAIMAHQL